MTVQADVASKIFTFHTTTEEDGWRMISYIKVNLIRVMRRDEVSGSTQRESKVLHHVRKDKTIKI